MKQRSQSGELSSFMLQEPHAEGLEPDGPPSLNPDHLVGHTLAGRYHVERLIGRGGMGIVYLASQTTIRRKVVVKVLPGSLKTDQKAQQRFEREARGLSTLQHPNIVTLHDFGYEQNLPYIVMEYVEGETLSDVMRRKRTLRLREFLTLAAQILGAIGEAHHQGLVHRDIKPDNIMLCERNGQRDFVKILDFGLARVMNDSEEITQQNLLGTALYLSPEQISGKDLDQRADVYALGILFYILLCGKKPFDAKDDVGILFQHINKQPRPLALELPPDHDIPQPLIYLVHQCLSKDPAARPWDAHEVLRILKGEVSFAGVSLPSFGAEPNPLFNSSEVRIPRQSGIRAASSADQQAPNTDEAALRPVLSAELRARKQQAATSSSPTLPQLTPSSPSIPRTVGDRDATRRWMILGTLLMALLLLVAALTLTVAYPSNRGLSESQLQILSKTEALISQERFGEADYLLKTVEADSPRDPESILKIAHTREQLDLGRLLVEARQREAQRDFDGAVQLYREVLRRSSSHPEARKRLDDLLSRHAKDLNFTVDDDLDALRNLPKPNAPAPKP